MPGDRRGANGDEGQQVKVTDRRRFTSEGEPLDVPGESGETGRPAAEEGLSPLPSAEETARDLRLAEQAARIDELTRAYAALVEDNKSFRQRLSRRWLTSLRSWTSLPSLPRLTATS